MSRVGGKKANFCGFLIRQSLLLLGWEEDSGRRTWGGGERKVKKGDWETQKSFWGKTDFFLRDFYSYNPSVAPAAGVGGGLGEGKEE